VASPAAATWSIVAVDGETNEVGVAIASCVPKEALGDLSTPLDPVVLLPGSAAAVTQAQLNLEAPPRIRELAAAQATPEEIIADISSAEFDEVAAVRQHAMVALAGGIAAFTGADNEDNALDAQGDGVSVQGNTLADRTVVESALARFEQERSDGTNLASSLVEALLAGSVEGGDRRCDEQTALFAQIVVATASDDAEAPSTLLTVTVDQDDGQNPVQLLADAYRDDQRGVIEAGTGTGNGGGGSGLLDVVAVLVVVGGIAGVILFRRGLGSTKARR